MRSISRGWIWEWSLFALKYDVSIYGVVHDDVWSGRDETADFDGFVWSRRLLSLSKMDDKCEVLLAEEGETV